ncbi:MATE family efflux transporter [Haloarchaeobius sp. TZWWS8]|uniref:MATE family efflux transporter n=1 Tax=Haloarchaeobius sp. TZWWS8 TaxID=3446121 RepID=UPI003EBE0B9F
MFRLAWPIVALQLLQVTYNIADTFWLGQYDTDALAAISLGFPLIFLLISLAGGFTAAGAILTAQYTGAKSEGSAGRVAGQTISFVSILAVGLGLVGYVFTEDMLALLPSQGETKEAVIPLAADYMEVFFLGIVFMFGFFVFSALMRGYGDTKIPMRVMLVSVAVNVVIDPLLIFGVPGYIPELGITGAAIATVASRGLGTVLGMYVLFMTDAGPDVQLHHLAPDLGVIRDIVEIGVPSALEQSASAFAMVTLTAMIVQFAPPVVAAYGLGNRIASLIFLPAMGLGRATNTMVGQNLGAGKSDRAERAVWLAAKVSAGTLLAVAVIVFLFPHVLVDAFISNDIADAAETIRHGAEYIRIRTVEFAFIGVLQVILGAYRGAGNTKTALAFSLVTLWVGRVATVSYLAFDPVPLLGVAGLGLGPTGFWYGMAMGNVVGAVAAGLWFTRGTWKQAVIEEEVAGPAASVADGGSDDE